MTILAYRDGVLVGDRRLTSHGLISETTKVFKEKGGELLGLSGEWDAALELAAWWRNGAEIDKFPSHARSSNRAELVVVRTDRTAWSYQQTPYAMEILESYAAFGSGRDFAVAALYMGASAMRAVEVACALESGCGNGMNVVRLGE